MGERLSLKRRLIISLVLLLFILLHVLSLALPMFAKVFFLGATVVASVTMGCVYFIFKE